MGAATALWVMMMIQDWYGLEGYIQHVRDHWIELPWWVGGAIAALSAWLGRDKTPNVEVSGLAPLAAEVPLDCRVGPHR